ncbi:hypothetical protein JXB27_01585 [Candidatus Woesearchaeota archaeon]|nr:hypothetical protein [Candidatus Woesearchaeota archaeon]
MKLTKKDRQLEHKIFERCDSELKKEGKGIGAKLSFDVLGSLVVGAVAGGVTYAATENIPLALKVAGVSSALSFYVGLSGSLDMHNDEIYQKMEPRLIRAGMNSKKIAELHSEYHTY